MSKFKTPLTIDEQIEYLEKNKRVVYKKMSKEKAREILMVDNYINVISPFKYMFAKKDKNKKIIKKDNRHIYTKDIDFEEYYNQYTLERGIYNKLFDKISYFEKTFNSIISNIVLVKFNIKNSKNFYLFVDEMLMSAANKEEYSGSEKSHMIEEISRFGSKINKYNSPYIFFDRLTLSETVTIYRLLDDQLKKETFKLLLSANCTIGYPIMSQFDEALTRLIQVRNCVYHNNSLTILLRYLKVKCKKPRTSTDTKKFKTLIRHLLNS